MIIRKPIFRQSQFLFRRFFSPESNRKPGRKAIPELNPSRATKPRVVICVGDVHGHHTKLQNLWSNLKTVTDPQDFRTAVVIFLGDYCDRGPDTKKFLDFLINLPSRYPNQKHVFLSGNHDFGFAAFVGALAEPRNGVSFREGWKDFDRYEEREGWYRGEGYEKMHMQGRRWGGSIKIRINPIKGTEYKGSVYDAGSTFESYGVPHGSPDLVKVVPEERKKFLADMIWVHEEDDVWIKSEEGLKKCKLIAVHAGLEKHKNVEKQLKLLKDRETGLAKIEGLCGRKNVWDIPKELTKQPTILVSGHHGKLHVQGLRLIIDEGGGLDDKPLAAIVLPSMRLVRDTDTVASSLHQLS